MAIGHILQLAYGSMGPEVSVSRVYTASMAGGVVRRVREEQGISRAALAERVGIGARTLYAFEVGESENFGLSHYLRLLDALGLALSVDLDPQHATPQDMPATPESDVELPFLQLGAQWRLDKGEE